MFFTPQHEMVHIKSNLHSPSEAHACLFRQAPVQHCKMPDEFVASVAEHHRVGNMCLCGRATFQQQHLCAVSRAEGMVVVVLVGGAGGVGGGDGGGA